MSKASAKAITLSLIPLFALLFVCCASIKTQNLRETIDKYNMAYKWGGPSATSPLIDESVRERILEERIKTMSNKSLVEYTIATLSFESSSKATAIVQYSYIDEINQSVHGFGELQTWERKQGVWRITNIVASNMPANKKFD